VGLGPKICDLGLGWKNPLLSVVVSNGSSVVANVLLIASSLTVGCEKEPESRLLSVNEKEGLLPLRLLIMEGEVSGRGVVNSSSGKASVTVNDGRCLLLLEKRVSLGRLTSETGRLVATGLSVCGTVGGGGGVVVTTGAALRIEASTGAASRIEASMGAASR